jgi:hypothetical protein
MLVIVGGHTRNIGKTSVMCAIIRATAHLGWTAIKITQYGHSVCSKDGVACECAAPDHPFALTQERDSSTGTDSSRYLAAGARQSYWARTAAGNLGEAIPTLRRIWTAAPNTIVESNSILQFVKPDLYLPVLDPSVADFKASSRRYLDRADAVLVVSREEPAWKDVADKLWRNKPVIELRPPDYTSDSFGPLILGG